MTSPRAEQIRRSAALAPLVLLGVLVVLSAWQRQRWDSDIFWALKSGEWIVSHMSVPRADPFSYTFGGSPWIDFTWGFQVLAWFFYTYMGGWTGLFILQAVLTSLIFLSLGINLWRLTSARAWLVASLLYLAFDMAAPRLYIRPHLFVYFFISLYLLLLDLFERRGAQVFLWLLLPLQVLWVNIHSSFVLGIFITGVWAWGAVADSLKERWFCGSREAVFTRPALMRILVSALMPVASLVNPYGYRLLVFPFAHQSRLNSDALRHIGEWVAHPLKEMFFYLYPFPLDHFTFLVAFTAVVAAMALNYRRLKVRDVALVSAAAYMAASHMRWMPLFAFLTLAPLAGNLTSLMDAPGRRLEPAAGWVCLVFTLVLAGFSVWVFSSPPYARNYGLGVNPSEYPSGTVEFMKGESLRGKIFNEYIFGGYIIHEYPQVKVFIDGRTPTVYSPFFFWTSRMTSDPRLWKRLVGEYGIEMALIRPEDPLCKNLRDDDEWGAVAFDDKSVLYLVKGAKFERSLSRWGLRDLDVCSSGPREKLPEEGKRLARVRGELKRLLARPGMERFARTHKLLGLADTNLGGEYLEEAVEELKKALSIRPDAESYYLLGLALGRLKRRELAVDAFSAGISLDSGFKDNHLALGLAYFDGRDYPRAVSSLERFVGLADDGAGYPAYKTLGLSYFELSDFSMAAEYLRRAAFLDAKPEEAADIEYHLGSALIETGDLRAGVRHYGLALATDPHYADVLKKLAGKLEGAGRDDAARAILEIKELGAQ